MANTPSPTGDDRQIHSDEDHPRNPAFRIHTESSPKESGLEVVEKKLRATPKNGRQHTLETNMETHIQDIASLSCLQMSQPQEFASGDLTESTELEGKAGVVESMDQANNASITVHERENGSITVHERENGEQSEVVKTGGDDYGANGKEGNGLCNPSFAYKLVDDFIFSDRSLIGRFTGKSPTLQDLSHWSKINWASVLKSICMFKTLGEGFFKIEFFSQEDCEYVLENGPWFMGVAGLSLKRWSSDFDPQNPGPLKTPIWLSLANLPLDFWEERSLIKVCSAVGKVLKISEATRKKSSPTAKVCVEVDLSEGLLPTIDLRASGVTYTQDLDYDGVPFRCKVCHSIEHLEGSCPKNLRKNMMKKK
eukprot:Gb_13691 [translate_table: standard]